MMEPVHIEQMLLGLTTTTKSLVLRGCKEELKAAINLVNISLAACGGIDSLRPSPELIFNAFRFCPLETAKIVLIGQDPYTAPGVAQGLSFSMPKNQRPSKSMKNVYEALINTGYIDAQPTHACLIAWAEQGVLLINAAFTTLGSKSNAHASAWANYTKKLLSLLYMAYPKLIYMAFGAFAVKLLSDAPPDRVLTWCHPSPLSAANQSDNPAHFKYCTAFSRANEILIEDGNTPVEWAAITNTPIIVAYDNVYLFTDGGAIRNGKPNASASWAFSLRNYDDDAILCEDSGHPTELQTNNRGELTAIIQGLIAAKKFPSNKLTIISDSDYSIKCINVYYAAWRQNGITDKKNLDLIGAAYDLIADISAYCAVTFQHINSHVAIRPADPHEAWLWAMNAHVDAMCTRVFG